MHYPDENNILVFETDTSDYGLGSVLHQIGEGKVIEPIAFMGRKFTDAALKWHTYKKECYSDDTSMKAFEDYIYGRWFYVYNDHQNLLQIAASTVPIIVRMRLYMQSQTGPLILCHACTSLTNSESSTQSCQHWHCSQETPLRKHLTRVTKDPKDMEECDALI